MKETIKNLLKIGRSLVINSFIFLISLLVPKSEDIVLFGGWFGKRFADNSRYLYLYCNEFKEKLGFKRVIWITDCDNIYNELEELDLEVYKKWSLKSIWYHLRCKTIFVDQSEYDINEYLGIRCNRVNLWHGFPLKKIGAFNKNEEKIRKSKYIKYFRLGGWSNYKLLCTSKLSQDILSKAFLVEKSKTIISGYPRNDIFKESYYEKYYTVNEKKIIGIIEAKKMQGYKVISYLPTFRDGKDIEFLNITNEDDFKRWNLFLEKNKLLCITKFHFANISNSGKIEKSDNIINLNSNVDIYPILKISDILISDYSSVYFDYMITGNPIVFYPFDIEYYSNDNRGLLFEYEKFTPGPKAYCIEELENEISSIIKNRKQYYYKYNKKYEEVKFKVFEGNLNKSCENIIDKVRKI